MSDGDLPFTFTVDTRQGGRSYMEDTYNILASLPDVPMLSPVGQDGSRTAYFAVFDGHGGAAAAEFARDHLLEEITKHDGFWSNDNAAVLKAIKDGFISTHRQTLKVSASWPRTPAGRPSTAGTTASVVFLRRNRLYIGHVGDSSVIITQKKDPKLDMLIPCCITKDHKPECKEERSRIESSGGIVEVKAGVHRVVWKRAREHLDGPVRRSTPMDYIPFLAIARSLGDLWSYNADTDTYVVSPVPDVTVIDLDTSTHHHLIIASDGLWNMVTPDETVRVVEHLMKKSQSATVESLGQKCPSPAAVLVRLALDRWSQRRIRADNTTVIVVTLAASAGSKCNIDSQQKTCENSHLPEIDTFEDTEELAGNSNISYDWELVDKCASPLAELNSSTILLPVPQQPLSCRRPIFKRRSICGGENKPSRSNSTVSDRKPVKRFQIPVTPDQRRAYSMSRPDWKGFM